MITFPFCHSGTAEPYFFRIFRKLKFVTAIVSTSPSKQTYLLAGNHSAFIIPRRKRSRQSLFSHNWRLPLDILYSLTETLLQTCKRPWHPDRTSLPEQPRNRTRRRHPACRLSSQVQGNARTGSRRPHFPVRR